MSWIQSHPELKYHRKFKKLAPIMGWSVIYTIGALHSFWWWCINFHEDGDLSKVSYDEIGSSVELEPGEKSKRFVAALVASEFLELKPYLRVRNWRERCEKYLTEKYRTKSPEKLAAFKKKNPVVKEVFRIPTLEEVIEYAKTIGFNINGELFISNYDSKGWKIGSTPMKSWKAAVRTWKINAKGQTNGFRKGEAGKVVGNTSKYKEAGFETD